MAAFSGDRTDWSTTSNYPIPTAKSQIPKCQGALLGVGNWKLGVDAFFIPARCVVFSEKNDERPCCRAPWVGVVRRLLRPLQLVGAPLGPHSSCPRVRGCTP